MPWTGEAKIRLSTRCEVASTPRWGSLRTDGRPERSEREPLARLGQESESSGTDASSRTCQQTLKPLANRNPRSMVRCRCTLARRGRQNHFDRSEVALEFSTSRFTKPACLDRYLDRKQAAGPRDELITSGSTHAMAAACLARPPWPTAFSGTRRMVRPSPRGTRGVFPGRRANARFAPVCGTLGTALARCGAVCGHPRIRGQHRASSRLALPGLCDPRSSKRYSLRSVHPRTDRRRSARTRHRDGLPDYRLGSSSRPNRRRRTQQAACTTRCDR